jgi:long-chain acyl-CoA synthetase
MLALGDEIKSRYDQSSLKCVIHAAAPCPIEVKLEMIKWWGEIIWEYYGASEGNGLTVIDSKEWLRHRGSVGKAKIGKVRICGDDGEELPRGETGLIYFSDSPKFEYHNDPQKTKDSRNQYGWSTLGDIGYLDSDDYLYLTDRKANTIISGGVNIYPQEIENHLLGHPAVKDVAVIGTPNNEFGEEVKAVVIPIQKSFEQDDLERELIEFCLVKVGKIKSPKSVDFVEELPRQENGKLYKRLLKDRYWKNER